MWIANVGNSKGYLISNDKSIVSSYNKSNKA